MNRSAPSQIGSILELSIGILCFSTLVPAYGELQSQEVVHSPFVPKGYSLIWNDEFNGTQWSTKTWTLRYPGARDKGPGWVSADAVTLNGKGQMLLTSREEDSKILNANIGTDKSFRHTFGYWEARLKFQQLDGQHGCFWLQSNVAKIPGDARASGVEVDVAEYFGPGRKDSGLGVNVYWMAADKKMKREGGIVNLDKVLSVGTGKKQAKLNETFHTYGLLWTAEEYVAYVDGEEVFRTKEGVSHQPAFAVFSLFSADWEVARLDRSKLPDSLIVDYVRVYDPKPSVEVVPEKN